MLGSRTGTPLVYLRPPTHAYRHRTIRSFFLLHTQSMYRRDVVRGGMCLEGQAEALDYTSLLRQY